MVMVLCRDFPVSFSVYNFLDENPGIIVVKNPRERVIYQRDAGRVKHYSQEKKDMSMICMCPAVEKLAVPLLQGLAVSSVSISLTLLAPGLHLLC